MRYVPTIIGFVLEIVLACIKLEFNLSHRISLLFVFLVAIGAAFVEAKIKPRKFIKVIESKNIKIGRNIVKECDAIIVKKSQDIEIADSPIPPSRPSSFKSFLLFLGILVLMILTYTVADWVFGRYF